MGKKKKMENNASKDEGKKGEGKLTKERREELRWHAKALISAPTAGSLESSQSQ